MQSTIYPCLWFNGNALEAANLYTQIFPDSAILSSNPMVVQFKIGGIKVMGLNGGPTFNINPSISLFVNCKSAAELNNYWNTLIIGGKVIMPLDTYPWAEKYGWLQDQFGMTWQLMINNQPETTMSIHPSFLFTGKQYGKAKEANEYYAQLFKPSAIFHQVLYESNEEHPEGMLKFGHFQLHQTLMSAMDGFGNHEFEFNEGVSIVVECNDQEEIDLYWNTLIKDGAAAQCGWLKDKYGVSWQIVPKIIASLMKEPEKAERVMSAMLKMKKIDIELLEKASY